MESTRADDAESESDEARADLKRATARGEVPSFVGDSIDAAHASEIGEPFSWKVASTNEPGEEAVGTELEQSISAGDILKRGQTVTLIVAAKRPKQVDGDRRGVRRWVEANGRVPHPRRGRRINYTFRERHAPQNRPPVRPPARAPGSMPGPPRLRPQD